MITTHQRETLLDNYARGLLNDDRLDQRYDLIEKLWVASGLTNKDLVDELLSDHENAADDFKSSIFWDMIWLLKQEVVRNSALRSLFCSLMGQRYPNVDRYIADLENQISDGKKISIGERDFQKFFHKNNVSEAGYYLFRLYNSDPIVEGDYIDSYFTQHEYANALDFAPHEADIWEESVCFTIDDQQPVFTSKFYQRYVKKQRAALAEYLQVQPEELAATYDKVMTIRIDSETDSLGFHSSGFGVISSSIIRMIWQNGGASSWLVNILDLTRASKFSHGYRPNFDKLFERYCKSNIQVIYQDCMSSDGTFTPMMLARECGFENMEALAESMGYIYMSDVVYQMYVQMQKQYYENFSWESFHNRDLKSRYETVIGELTSALSIRENELKNSRHLYEALKQNLSKQTDEVLLREAQDKERLIKLAEEKDAEIERLKAIIASQNQMIEELQTPDSDTAVTGDTDLSEIYQHRYLFVGDYHALGFDELKRNFPGSIFMDTSTMNISQIQVDYVVYLIQAMGHSMHYKCKNTPCLRDVKTIYYNGRGNIDALYEILCQGVRSRDTI